MKRFKLTALFAAVFMAHTAIGVQLENWRFPYYQAGSLITNEGSSPSGLFWDDIGGQTFLDPALWPDSARFRKNQHAG